MTNREGISNVRKLFKEVNADGKLTNKFAFSLLKKHSHWLIKRDSDNLKLMNLNDLYQIIKCVKVEEAPAIDPCCGIKSNKCVVYRTSIKIPKLYEDAMGVLITRITSIDRSTDIEFTTALSAKRKLNNPWMKKGNKSKIYAFYFDDYVYFANSKHLKMIQIEGLFDAEINPIENCDPCKDCEKDDCKRFLDKKFILPKYLEAQVFDYVKKDLMEVYKQLPEKSHEINKSDNNPN